MKLVEKILKSSGLAAAAALLSFGLGTPEAQACGGFFCNNSNPTVQTGERILFTVDDENIRAYVQVYYDGPADDFAWIIPVASNPDVGVGTDAVFTRLDQLTSPRFQIEMDIAEECYGNGFYDSDPEMMASADSAGGGSEGGADESENFVNVIAQGDAGPYNYTTLESNNSDLLVAWLNENDYAQPPEALPLIEHYVANEMLFVAVKLQPAKDVGDIAPIILDFQEQSPCVPLVLTQVAATPDMPVKAYVLGKERAVPTNWLHVTVNEKKLDWFSLQNNWWFSSENLEDSYHMTLIDAIAEAEGHAFTTEYAGESNIMDKQLDSGQYDNVSELLQYEDAADFVMALQNYFTGSSQLMNILRTHVPVPEGYNEQDFYNWPEGYSAEYAAMNVDLEALYNELLDVIVKPIQEAQDMFDAHPYLTRMYSRVGIDFMDRDPIFDFQAGEPVSNIHKATFKMTCDAEGMNYHMELENGETFIPTNVPSWWNIDENANGGVEEDIAALPAADRIELFTPGAAPRIVQGDDAAYVDEQLDILPAEQVEVPGADLVEDVNLTTTGTNIRSGGCSTGAAGQNNLGWMMLLMVGLASLRRSVVNRS